MFFCEGWVYVFVYIRSQVRKGARWMPWHLEPMKGVASDEKLRIAASRLTRRYPNGATLHRLCCVTSI
jgi:hypothetical protein